MQLLAGTFAGVTLAAVIAGCGGSTTSTDGPVVSLDTTARIGTVNPLLFGVNHRWLSNGVGTADPQTGITYTQVSDQIKDVGFTMIRYPGGTLANTFQWTRAIGPQARRGLQVGGMPIAALALPEDSTFGPDEYGNLLDVTGATGDLMLNVATAGPADSANFVAYMTAPQGSAPVNGVDWAARRAANGHPAPYKVAYAELGNEYDPSIAIVLNGQTIDQNYWIDGAPVSFNNPACAATKIECLYAFGGSTRFTGQPVVAQTDWRPATSISNGAPNQVLYARYAPIVQGSETVYVNGVAWQSVPDIGVAAGAGNVYQLDDATGAIRFGDGTHGAIPPARATMTITYTSGPHAGFVDHYQAIKAVNPAIKICSSIFDGTFVKLMGAQYAYDCLVQHLYAALDASKSSGLPDFFGQVMRSTDDEAAKVQATQASIKQYAGANARNVSMLLSEYGHLGTMPSYAPHFPRSLGEGVMHGLFLRQWMLNGIEAADRHVLTDYTYGTPAADLAAISSGDNALLQGPGPSTIESPTALAMKLFTQNTGDTLVNSTVTNNPVRTLSNGQSLAALQTVATTDAAGNAYLIVINEDPENAVNATVSPQGTPRSGNATVSTLNSPNITDENNPTNATAVQIARRSAQIGTGSFNWTFPAHSISAIKFSS